jgi:hypothetical protein
MRYCYDITIERYPCVFRPCAHCGAIKPFVPSGQIRLNAQKKRLDVWLIHKCRDCGSTWNMEVFSRISPAKLERGLYERLLANDEALVRSLAFDPQLHARIGAPLSEETLRYAIVGAPFPLEALTEPAEIEIACAVPLGVRLSKLLREILGLSHRQFEAMVASGALTSADGIDLKRARMDTCCTVNVLPR